MRKQQIPILIGILCLALIIAVMPLVGACAAEAPSPEKPIVAIVSHTYAPGTIWARQVELLKEHVEKATNGRVEVKIYPAGTLHTTYEQGMMACVKGSNQFAFINTTSAQKFDPRWTCLTCPGNVWGWEHWKLIQEIDVYKQLNEDLAKNQGIKVLFWSVFAGAERGVTVWNTKHPIVTPDDWKGLKIRTGPSPQEIAVVEAFGASAIPLPTPETVAAISQGVVDGGLIGRGGAIAAWAAPENLPYVTVFHGGFDLGSKGVGFFVNVDWWNSLPKDIREAIEAEIPAMREHTNKENGEDDLKNWQKYVDAGNTISYLTEEETMAWSKILEEKVLPQLDKEYGCADIFEACKAVRP